MSFQSLGRGHGAPHVAAQPMAEINTTPLVDVMLVLLVIFIITAPLFHQAVQVDLPRANSSKLHDKPFVMQVAIDAGGSIFVDGRRLARQELDAVFQSARQSGRGDPELHLRADRGTRYEQVTDVMAAAQRQGLTKIAFVTEPVGDH